MKLITDINPTLQFDSEYWIYKKINKFDDK
jgi:hypothetical protein